MLIKDHPEDESIFGKRVLNHKKTQAGTVVAFFPSARYPAISIDWDNGKKSEYQFIMCLELEILGD